MIRLAFTILFLSSYCMPLCAMNNNHDSIPVSTASPICIMCYSSYDDNNDPLVTFINCQCIVHINHLATDLDRIDIKTTQCPRCNTQLTTDEYAALNKQIYSIKKNAYLYKSSIQNAYYACFNKLSTIKNINTNLNNNNKFKQLLPVEIIKRIQDEINRDLKNQIDSSNQLIAIQLGYTLNNLNDDEEIEEFIEAEPIINNDDDEDDTQTCNCTIS